MGPAREPGGRGETVTLLRFRVAGARLAIPVATVEEIADRGTLTAIPGVPPHVPGLMPIRGEAIPLLDLRSFFQLGDEESAEERRPRVLVVQAAPYRVGLLCDRVEGVHVVPPTALEPPRSTQPPALRDLTTAELDSGDAVTAVLDVPRLLEASRA